MDQYSGGIPTTSSYNPLPSIAPQQLQHNASLPPHTLPPLQAQQVQHNPMSMHAMYQQPMSAPHTPSTSTPNTPGPVSNGAFQQMNSQSGSRGYHPGGPYQQPMHSYNNTSSSMMPQSSTAMSHPQAIAPAPATSRQLVPLRPNPTMQLHNQHSMHPHMHPGISTPYGQQQEEAPPTHVVGSQGRRGILPSAPGHPAVGATVGGSTKHAPIPAKDADGKFPCPHCTKTYLHAKHLKRHLLRHTGDRPYMCVLCKDTFSRSDILKRHFQKCSIRRGNPSNLTHLEFAQSHLKKTHPGAHKNSNPSSTDGDMARNLNGVHNGPQDSNVPIFGNMVPDSRLEESHSNLAGDEAAQSRVTGLKRLSNGGAPRDRRSLTGPGPSGSNRASFDQNFNGGPPSSLSNINPQLAAYALPNGHNGTSFGQNYDFSNGGSVHQQEDMANGSRGVPMYGDQWGSGQMFTTPDGN